MTIRKADVPLPVRTPAYVSRDIGAAELGVSPNTWDKWVAEGRLPPAAPGFPSGTPRWRWADVDRRMSGTPDQEPVAPQPETEDADIAEKLKRFWGNGKTKGRRGSGRAATA